MINHCRIGKSIGFSLTDNVLEEDLLPSIRQLNIQPGKKFSMHGL